MLLKLMYTWLNNALQLLDRHASGRAGCGVAICHVCLTYSVHLLPCCLSEGSQQ